MAIHLKVDGTKEVVKPGDGRTDFNLDELKKYIGGGYIQIIRLNDDRMVVMDEEAKLKNFELNLPATRLCHEVLWPGDYISGDVLICLPGEIE